MTVASVVINITLTQERVDVFKPLLQSGNHVHNTNKHILCSYCWIIIFLFSFSIITFCGPVGYV